MSRRIEIELTSARPDGSWTWRAAGAQKPKGVLDGALLPAHATVGLVVKADAEYEIDGITILAVMDTKAKADKPNMLEMLPSDKPFEAVIETRARRERGDRPDRGDRSDRRDRGPRRDGDSRSDRGPRRDGPAGERRDRAPRREGATRPEGRGGERRPRFDAPPELPQRPKAKRLKPGRAHRNAALAGLDPAQRTIAERVLQGGIPAVRQAVTEQNARLKAEGSEPIEPHGLLQLAEQLQPALRVAEWLDRADAAVADLEELDLRDLRSVVAAAEDPMVARDESTREVAATLKAALTAKQDREQTLWFDDIEAAIGVGRVVRALKLSSQPPKAGVPFPGELAGRLAAAATGNLTADALPERWIAVLEAVAFSPVRSQVVPSAKPAQVNDELLATVKRLGSRVPAIAALFGVDVDPKAQPKPLRPTRPKAPAKPAPASGKPAAPAAPPVVPAATEVVSAEVVDAAPVASEPAETPEA